MTVENKKIIVKDLNLYYGDNHALKNVNMNIRKGEKICIVGHNGAGKTTLVKLLMRLYDVNAGVISVAGRDIKEYNESLKVESDNTEEKNYAD